MPKERRTYRFQDTRAARRLRKLGRRNPKRMLAIVANYAGQRSGSHVSSQCRCGADRSIDKREGKRWPWVVGAYADR
jgi:hypothetical protein